MPRRHVVSQLDDQQLDFVIRQIIAGETDREISLAFETQFEIKLAKSSLSRWRQSAGAELVERYRLARFTANQLVEDLKLGKDADKFQIVIANIEDRLLTATRDVIAKDPVKLLQVRQEEERRRLKERELTLKEKQHEFEREKDARTAAMQTDKFKIAADAWSFILQWLAQHDAASADLLTKHSKKLLVDLEENLENQTA